MSGLEGKDIFWPRESLRQGVESLLAAAGYSLGATSLAEVPPLGVSGVTFAWLTDATRSIGLEGSGRQIDKKELLSTLIRPGAHVVPLFPPSDREESRIFFVTVVSEGFRSRLICPDGSERICSTIDLTDAILRHIQSDDTRLAEIFGTVEGGADVLRRMMARERFDDAPLNVFTYRPDAASPLLELVKHDGAFRHVAAFFAATLVQILVTAVAAFTLGSAALDGLVDRGRVIAWIMISVVAVPFAFIASLRLSEVALSVGSALKRRSLEGAFFLDEDILRREGVSAQIARLNEASMLERISVDDAFGLLVPVMLVFGSLYLFVSSSRHAGPLVICALLMLALQVLVALRNGSLQITAYRLRTVLTGDLVDKLIGHRTRAVQENPAVWHTVEDRRLLEYTATLSRLDNVGTISGLLPRLWLLVASAVLAFYFVVDSTADDIVVSAIGVVMFSSALGSFGAVAERGAMLVTAWQAIRSLFEAGRHRTRAERTIHTTEEQNEWPTVLAASALAFSYRPGARPVFTDASLRIRKGERILVEGPSGGGKTTFAKIVAGELRPRGGSIIVCGLDPFTGSETQWRKLVASVPQFHENHIFSQTFSFNIDPLSGRSHLTDEARKICEELELGPLLAKMPAGTAQLLGETGWQLSHGERSRVFIARALLQKAQLIIMDESFAALDPVTMRVVVDCVKRRARTLMVIAHV